MEPVSREYRKIRMQDDPAYPGGFGYFEPGNRRTVLPRQAFLNLRLAQAAHDGDLRTVRQFIKLGAETDEKHIFVPGSEGTTAMGHAAANGHLDVVRFLHKKAGVQLREDGDGREALLHAASNGQHEVVRYMVKNGQPGRESLGLALHKAAEYGHNDVVRYLLSKGASVDHMDNGAGTGTPLAVAAQYAHLGTAKLLLKQGANPNLRDQYAPAPLHAVAEHELDDVATRNNKLEIAKLLLRNNADPHVKNQAGKKPIDLATGNRMKAILRKAMER